MNRSIASFASPFPASMHGTCQRAGTINRHAGVSLIEVLVAVLVLSIGFLGIAALQALALSTNNSAMARSMATIDSYSILDAMRADAASARAGAYNAPAVTGGGGCPAAVGGSLANTQLIHWCNQLASDLGDAITTTGAINCGATGVCTITITFDDSRGGAGGGSAQSITTTAML